MCFFFQAEDGIRDLVRSRGLGDVYKRQVFFHAQGGRGINPVAIPASGTQFGKDFSGVVATLGADDDVTALEGCLLYTSDAADERSSVDLGGRRIIKKKNKQETERAQR